MKKFTISLISIIFILFCSSAFIIKDSSGIPGRTGSPGETTCIACHSPGAPLGTISITSSPAFSSNKYIPNQTYTVFITLKHPTLGLFGFDCEILNSTVSGAINSGYIWPASGTGYSVITYFGGKKNAIHNGITPSTGIGPFTKVFSFKWDAPPSGTAVIYTAGLAINNDGATSGDATKTASLVLTANTSTGILPIETSPTILSVYPNPSFSSFNIKYSLLNDNEIKGSLYNLQGKEIAVLFNEQQTLGVYNKTILYPNDLPAGMYLIKLLSNNKCFSEKMIIKQ